MEAIGSNQGEDIATICSDESDDSSSVSSGSSSVSSASESSGDDSPTYRLVRILVLAATALGSLCNIYATSLAANFTASAINAVFWYVLTHGVITASPGVYSLPVGGLQLYHTSVQWTRNGLFEISASPAF